MASIRKRGATWQARVWHSERGNYTKSFPRKSLAVAWARSIEAGFQLPKQIEYPPLVVLIERYRKTVTPKKKGAEREDRRLAWWARSVYAGLPADQITSSMMSQWRDKKLESRGPNTVLLDLYALSNVYKHAQRDWGYEQLKNPIAPISKPSPSRGRSRRLLEGEFELVLEAIPNPQMRNLAQLCLFTGMRLSEAMRLQWADVDLERCVALLRDTKNGYSRTIPLSADAVSLLRSMQKSGVTLFYGLKDQSKKWSEGVRRARKRWVAANPQDDSNYLVDLRFHDLRHEATSQFFEKGLNVIEVSSITGHRDLSMLKRYTHLKAEDLAEKLNAA
jgi:integrase